MTAFSTLNVLPAAQLNNLTELGYLEMTPVQAAALPVILAGNDVRVQARTGSGKTAAFGLGLLHRIDVTLFQTQALVLCPTRELADQVCRRVTSPGPFFAKYQNSDLVWRATLWRTARLASARSAYHCRDAGALAGSFTKRNRIAGCAAHSGNG